MKPVAASNCVLSAALPPSIEKKEDTILSTVKEVSKALDVLREDKLKAKAVLLGIRLLLNDR